TPAGWLAGSRDEEMVVSAQGRGGRGRSCRGAESAGSVRALPALPRRACRVGNSPRSERHPGVARHASADLPRLPAPKKAVRIPCRTGNCREEIALQSRLKPENRFISDINDPARAPAGGSGRGI